VSPGKKKVGSLQIYTYLYFYPRNKCYKSVFPQVLVVLYRAYVIYRYVQLINYNIVNTRKSRFSCRHFNIKRVHACTILYLILLYSLCGIALSVALGFTMPAEKLTTSSNIDRYIYTIHFRSTILPPLTVRRMSGCTYRSV